MIMASATFIRITNTYNAVNINKIIVKMGLKPAYRHRQALRYA
jgi:ribosomal protein L5